MSNIQINIKNYEEYALDYLEGNLSEDTRASFDIFLSKNPAIEEELSNLLDFRIAPNALTYDEKDKLKKRKGLRRYGIIGFFTLTTGLILLTGLTTIFYHNDQRSSDEAAVKTETNAQATMDTKQSTSNANELMDIDKITNDTSKTESDALSTKLTSLPLVPNSIAKQSTIKANSKLAKKKSTPTTTHDFENKKVINTRTQNDTRVQEPSLSKEKVLEKNKQILPHQQIIKSAKNSSSDNVDRSITSVTTEDIDKSNAKIKAEELAVIDQRALETVEVASIDTIRSLKMVSPSRITQLEHTSAIALAKALNERLPTIIIPEDDLEDDIDIAAVDNVEHEDVRKNKKFKIRFRNFLPEQFAGLTKEDIKRSLIPETFTTTR